VLHLHGPCLSLRDAMLPSVRAPASEKAATAAPATRGGGLTMLSDPVRRASTRARGATETARAGSGLSHYCWMMTPKVTTADWDGPRIPMLNSSPPVPPFAGTVVTVPTVVAAGFTLV